MSLTMYQTAVPTFVRMLENLSAVLKKGEEHAKSNGINEADLITAKLAEDMFPLARQIQIASDAAKGAGARLAQVEVPSFEDTETTFADLQERIAKTVSFLKSVDAAKMDGSESRAVTVKTRNGELNFSNGLEYLMTAAFPNFFFHVTTAYDILRHNGVQLGKKDFLGNA